MLPNLIVIALAIVTFGCGNHSNNQMVKCHDDGRAKPIVAFVPLFDRSGAVMPWNLSEELSYTMQRRLTERGECFLTDSDVIKEITSKLTDAHNPFGNELAWTKNAFSYNEFVVFTELIEHQIHPKELRNSFIDKITPSYQLDMTIRIRVIDLRFEKPQVILQELVQQSHLIPKPVYEPNGEQDKWKKRTYAVSPISFAHLQMTKNIARRIEDYILLAKTK